MRRRIFHRSQIRKEFFNSLIHWPGNVSTVRSIDTSMSDGPEEWAEVSSLKSRAKIQDLAPTGVASSGWATGASGASFSQSHPSLMQARTVPILDFFSTTNG